MTESIILHVENLRKSYDQRGGKRVVAVNDVSFTLKKGEILALLGPNGAGKTTTIKMISGLLEPSTGAVRINGIDPFDDRSAMRQIGSVLEGNRNLYWRLTSFENLVYFATLKGVPLKAARKRAADLLARMGLEKKSDVQARSLSRGMQQRLAIAVSVIHEPSLLLLDEPGLGLDAKSRLDVQAMIEDMVESGIGVLMTTHQLDLAEDLADRVAIIDEGRIIKTESTKELLRRHASGVYEIHLSEPLAPEQVLALSGFPHKIATNDCIEIEGGVEVVYDVLERLRPAGIQRICRHKSDLSSIYLRLTEPAARLVGQGVEYA